MSPQRFDPDAYVAVEERLMRFRAEHPDGVIVTELHNDGLVYVQATVSAAGGSATGMKAVPGQGDSPIEKAETGAIGRALVNFGYSAKRKTARQRSSSTTGAQASPQPAPVVSTSQPSVEGEATSAAGALCPHGAKSVTACVLCRKAAA